MERKKFPWYPIYLDIENRDVLIVGGGNVSARKAGTLMKYGAKVTILSPEISDEIREWADSGKLKVVLERYVESFLDGKAVVIGATGDPCVNARIARDCRRRRIPVNVVDVTHLSEFIVPSIIEQGSIQIAVSTGGKSPALARTIRETLEKTIGMEYSEVNDLLGSLRKSAKKALPTDRDRKRFFDGIIARDIVTLLRQGQNHKAWQIVADACRESGVPLSPELEARLRQ